MEALAIGLISTVVFGTVIALSAIIRHLLLSRDKKMNDEAQHRALNQEAEELKNIRQEMQNRKRMTAHYKLLKENKHAIQHLDDKIYELTQKKADLITRWSDLTIAASKKMIDNISDTQPRSKFYKLKEGIDISLSNYAQEISQLQKRREVLLSKHQEISAHLLDQEKRANENLDSLYEKHSLMLEKMFIRHNKNTEHIATKAIEAGTNAFAMIIKAPFKLLLSYFKSGVGFDKNKVNEELKFRKSIEDEEYRINQKGDSKNDFDKSDFISEDTQLSTNNWDTGYLSNNS